MRSRILSVVLALGLCAVGLVLQAEPRFASISATSSAASTTLSHNNSAREVTLYNAGSKTVYFRLFTDADEAAGLSGGGNATTSSAPLPSGASLSFVLNDKGIEAFVGSTKAKFYKSLSTICGGSDTTTVYVYYK